MNEELKGIIEGMQGENASLVSQGLEPRYSDLDFENVVKTHEAQSVNTEETTTTNVEKTKGSQTTDVTAGPYQPVSKGTVLSSETISSESLDKTNTWVDANGNPIGFEYPEVKITSEENEEIKKPTLLEKIGNINIFKGKTLNDFFPKKKDKKEEIEEEIEEVKIELPTSEADATNVGGGTSYNLVTGSVIQSGETIQPEILEEEKIGTSYYYDEEDGEIKEDVATTLDELLEDKPFTFTFDGEKIYLDEPVVEEEEEEPKLATTWLGDVFTGIAKIYNLGVSVYEDKGERDQLLDNIEKRYYDINNNLAIGMQSIYIDGLKLLEESFTPSKVGVDPKGNKAGLSALDDMFGDYGEVVWFSPEGKIVPLADKTLTAEERYAQGYMLIYKDSGIKVGDPYKQYVVSKYEYLLEIEAAKNNPELAMVEGYKEGDAAMFFGGVFNAVTSLAETMGPAIATKGFSLIPQITAPFYIDAAREKAKRLYPNLPEKDAIEKLVMSGDEDVLIPNLLGLAAGQLERIGFKGIIRAMRMNPATFSQGVTVILLSGQREGITEWSQTGLEIFNKSIAAGEEKAIYLAWAGMTGPQGLEAYLQGVVGGTGVSTAGSLINRALRTNREDIAKINNIVRKQNELNGKLNAFNQKASKYNQKLRDYYMSEIAKLNADLVDIFNNSNKLSKYLTKEEQEFIGFLLKSYDKKTLEYHSEYYETYKGVFEYADSNGISVEQALKENYPQLDAQWQELKVVLEKEAIDIVNQINDIRKRANERMIDDGIKKADKRGIMRTVFETKDDVSNWLNDPANQEMFEKQAKEDGITVTELKNQYKNANGWELDGEVFVNKPKAIETGAVGVTEHEIAHILFGKSIRDKNGNITKEGHALIVKFKKAIGPRIEAIILGRLKANGYKIDGPNANPNAQEEFLTFYLDGVREGEWKENKAALKLLGKEVTSLLKDSGYTNIKFKTAQDIMDWFTSYIEDKDSGKSKVERTPPSKTVSLSSFSTTDLEGPVIELGNVSQDTWNKTGADNAITYIFGKLDGMIKKKITLAMQDLPDFSEEDFIQKTYMELIPHIRNFVPAQYNEDGSRKLDGNGNVIGNDNLWAWITSQLGNKSLEALKSDDVTKSTFETSVQDENSFINDIEADEYVDLELAIEEDVTYSGLRNILGIKRGGELHKKIIEGIKRIIPLEIKNLDTATFKNALKKYFNNYLFDDIKKVLGGTATKEGYKNFITNNAEALYNLFPQPVFNKSFQDFIVKGDRLTVPETREAQKKGLLPKTLTEKQMADGIYLYTKLPWNDDVEQKWIDNFLNPPKGRPASKQNSLIELISYTLGIDATMEVINSEEFKGKHEISDVVIATIGMKIDRGANVRFNKTNGSEGNLNENNFDKEQAMDMVKYIETEVGFDEIGPGDVADLLKTNFPTADEDVIALIERMADLGYIKDQNGTMFLQGIMLSKDIDKKDKDQVKEDTLEDKQEKLNKAANILAPRLGPEVMNLLGYDILGYINRMMDAAEKKKNPAYKYDKTQPQYLEDDAGNLISGPFYKDLEALKLKVKNSEVILPEGLDLDLVRLMNKKFVLFKKIEKILNDGDSKIDGSNIAWKKAEILKLDGEITAAGEANIKLAKFIASEIIKADEIDVVTTIHLLQIQTNAVSGFRALTTLDLITILEGSQKADENHPYYEAELAIAKKAKHKSGKLKGQLKYPTEKLAIEAAIKVLGTKGEHAAANANTMLKIAILKAKYMKNKNIDVDLELTKIFQGHGQIHGTKGTFNLLDKFGTTNVADWLRLMLDPRRKDMFSPDGKTAEEVIVVKTAPLSQQGLNGVNWVVDVAVKTTPTSRFSKTDNKVIFAVGGAGSGKSNILQQLGAYGDYIVINPDIQMEEMLKAAGLSLDPTVYKAGTFERSQWSKIQQLAIKNSKIAMQKAMEQGRGMIIDGTGASANVMAKNYTNFKEAGYDVAAIQVETSIEVALNRNADRERSLPDRVVINNHDNVNTAVNEYKSLFGPNFFKINTDNLNQHDALPKPFVDKYDTFTNKGGVMFSISDQFNQIIEENEGIKKESVYSKAKANILGSKVVKFWDFIYPPSAYDLELFLYRILGKGEKGEKDMLFFKENLLDPYNQAYANIQEASQKALKQYRDLVKKLPKVRKKLSKKVPGSKFTYDQAIRVSIWNDMGIDMQEMGLSKADQKILIDAVKGDIELSTFKDALKNIPGKDGYVKPSVNWTVETIAYDLNMAINSVSRAKFLGEWKNNVEQIFSEENKRKLEVLYGKEYVEALEDMLYRMEYGRGKNIAGRIERNWNNWVNNSVGAIMFFNFRSASLQTISFLNYFDWKNNSPLKIAKVLAKPKQFISDVVYIFNSDYLLERRSGNKRTINEAELSAWLKGKENKAKAFLAFLLEKGFTPTQIADSFAIAFGGAFFYRNQVDFYIEQGMPLKEAEKAAWKDFIDKTEKGQQSSRPDLISQQQAGGLGRLILAFKNTPMQYNRLMIKAVLDLKNGRGKTSENLSKIAYYGLIQNVIFTSLQTALFAALGDEDEWDSKKERVANGMIDSILNGMGLTGAVVATIKNGYLRYRREKKRGFNADHTRTIIEFANLSPTIGSKLRKLYGSIRTEQLNKEAIEGMGFTIENPAFNSIANLVSAATNVPLDRAVTIAQNLILASKDETEFWESTMLILGWNPWDIGVDQTSREVQRELKEKKKKLMKTLKKLEDQQKKEEELKKKQEEQKKKGEPLTCSKCNRKALPGKTVCTVHEVKEQRKDGVKKRCIAKKADKTQCKEMTANKSGKCYYHD